MLGFWFGIASSALVGLHPDVGQGNKTQVFLGDAFIDRQNVSEPISLPWTFPDAPNLIQKRSSVNFGLLADEIYNASVNIEDDTGPGVVIENLIRGKFTYVPPGFIVGNTRLWQHFISEYCLPYSRYCAGISSKAIAYTFRHVTQKSASLEYWCPNDESGRKNGRGKADVVQFICETKRAGFHPGKIMQVRRDFDFGPDPWTLFGARQVSLSFGLNETAESKHGTNNGDYSYTNVESVTITPIKLLGCAMLFLAGMIVMANGMAGRFRFSLLAMLMGAAVAIGVGAFLLPL